MSQRIVYLSWPAREISGGIKLAFRHVETLTESGFDAIIATPDGQPPAWFETTAPVVSFDELSGKEDVLVFPENHAGYLKQFAGHAGPKLVFCQNPFFVSRGLGGQQDYAAFGVSAILAEGWLTCEFCRRRFPGVPVHQVSGLVDEHHFSFQAEKRLQIAFAPRKRSLETAVIRDLFHAENPDLRRIPWVEIAGMPEPQVARVLRDSAVYLSLARLEAVGLSGLEAMACGCVVVGFTGQGGREYATKANGFWVPEDDCLVCATELARAVRMLIDDRAAHLRMIEAAQHTVIPYRRQAFVRQVTGFWRQWLEARAGPGQPEEATPGAQQPPITPEATSGS